MVSRNLHLFLRALKNKGLNEEIVTKIGSLNLSDFVVDCSGAVCVYVRLTDTPYFHAIGSKTARRCTALQPVLTRYKLL